ncbi:hypothetical protein RvY_08047 [Ramazzottius varieornatus]|uniref:Small ribosomal subunit protein uS7 domain-containing protein n=1 Tax=Ramazzottius varieornatus TaxID=947166 RepID=A0A1D1V4D2_RAMVA|nr:hypothetical protein RvY_08047 [Ramazzottius varieornatus]
MSFPTASIVTSRGLCLASLICSSSGNSLLLSDAFCQHRTAFIRNISRLRTRTPKKVYWFKRMAPPVFDATEIQRKLEETPEARFMKVGPARIHESSSAFYDPLLNKFTNMIMFKGQKELAEENMRLAFENIKKIQMEKYHATTDVTAKMRVELNPLKIFHQAVENCKPVLALTPIKRGGVTYQVPVSVRDKTAEWTAMKWLILAGREHEHQIHFRETIAKELIAAFQNEGRVIKRKYDLHKQCEANKAYAHYRWSR